MRVLLRDLQAPPVELEDRGSPRMNRSLARRGLKVRVAVPRQGAPSIKEELRHSGRMELLLLHRHQLSLARELQRLCGAAAEA